MLLKLVAGGLIITRLFAHFFSMSKGADNKRLGRKLHDFGLVAAVIILIYFLVTDERVGWVLGLKH